jgi:pimeloyl-ACP methyl ester carboxylesterase
VQSTFSSASPWKAGFFSWIATAQGAEYANRDVVLVNTRGTGRDAVNCPLLQSEGNSVGEAVHECVGILGRSIDYFTNGDSADDLDAVRAYLLGRTAKVDLVTMGHSSSVGQAYLARYPQHVHTAILSDAQNIDAWSDVEIKDSTAIVGRVCARSERCSAQIDDAVAQVAWLAARVRRAPITGMSTLPDGTPQRIVLGEFELAWGLVEPEQGTFARGAGLAAAIKAYRNGDSQPLLRLAANAGVGDGVSDQPLTAPDDQLTDWSASGFAAAYCNEWPTAYDLSADETTRRVQAAQRLAGQPADLYGIFSHALFGNWEECWPWPGPKRVNRINPPGSSYPNVPVLVLAGDLNSDHPATASRTVAARYPQATYVLVPRAGQPALLSGCAARIMQHFLQTTSAGDTRCATNEGKAVLSIGSFPRLVAEETPARAASGADRSTMRDRRVAAEAVYTSLDAVVQVFDVGAQSGPALRGGTWAATFGDEGAVVTLHDAQFASDVTVNGDFNFSFVGDNAPARLTVSGPGTANGELVVDIPAAFSLDHPTAHVTGQIGGRRFDLTVDIH